MEQEKYLVESVGLSVEEARARMQDDDLWLVPPEQRFALLDEGEIQRMERAGNFMADLATTIASHTTVPDEAMVLLLDARNRAQEAARRARQRIASSPE